MDMYPALVQIAIHKITNTHTLILNDVKILCLDERNYLLKKEQSSFITIRPLSMALCYCHDKETSGIIHVVDRNEKEKLHTCHTYKTACYKFFNPLLFFFSKSIL